MSERSSADRGATSLPTVRTHPFDPPPQLRVFRETEPLKRLVYPDGHLGWLVTSYALARSVLADARFSARKELQRLPVRRPALDAIIGSPALPGFFLDMDAPEHTRYRRLLAGHFTVRRMNRLRQCIDEIVEQRLDVMAGAGPPADLVEIFELVPAIVICDLLGVPVDRRTEFQRINSTLLSLEESSAEEGKEALLGAIDLVAALVRRKRTHPRDDLLSRLTEGDLTDEEAGGVGVLLLLAGIETTANMLSLGAYALLERPGLLCQLRETPGLVDSTVEELLRYLTIFQFGRTRTAIENVYLEGRLIEAGETVTVSLSAANRDPMRFENPDQLDPERPANGHLAFGHGIHQCIGQQLARVEMRAGLLALARNYPSLHLAMPAEIVMFRDNMATYGVHRLVVAW